jgi:hypothetical protein
VKTCPVLSALVLALTAAAGAGEPSGPMPLPKDAPKLKRDVIVMLQGSSVCMNKYRTHGLPKWTGGGNRVPPQLYCQNVFFRVFEMLNDHENMRWRRLPDADWKREGEWKPETKLEYNGACYGKRVAYSATDPKAWAELKIPAGFEKVDLIYTTGPKGDKIKVLVDGRPPKENALVDTRQDTRIPAAAKFGPDLEVLDSHGKPRKIRRPRRGARNLYELRARYQLEKSKPHTLRVQRATGDPGRRILVWGAVYWRGNCVQVVQRAKGGINCGDLPNYAAIQETVSIRPDYVLMEAINIRGSAAGVTKALGAGYSWCARQAKAGKFKVMVFETSQANCRAFRKHFSDPKNKSYGKSRVQAVADENADACHRAVVDLCKKYGFPRVDVGPAVDKYLAANPTARFVPHVQNDWYHPNQWGAALFGQTIHDGIKKHWPELPVRPVNMPAPPGGK